MPDKELKLTGPEVTTVLRALSELPYNEVANLIHKITYQASVSEVKK